MLGPVGYSCTVCTVVSVYQYFLPRHYYPSPLESFLKHFPIPEQIAAKDEAEHEDEEANAQHNDVHIEREVVDVRRHVGAVLRVRVLLETPKTHLTSWEEEQDKYSTLQRRMASR